MPAMDTFAEVCVGVGGRVVGEVLKQGLGSGEYIYIYIFEFEQS